MYSGKNSLLPLLSVLSLSCVRIPPVRPNPSRTSTTTDPGSRWERRRRLWYRPHKGHKISQSSPWGLGVVDRYMNPLSELGRCNNDY